MLTACSFGIGRMFISCEDKIADERLEQVLSSIKAEDKGALKALFSKQALEETNDFDNGVDYLFDLFQGDVESWEREKWSSSESIQYGEKSVEIRSWYTVSTDKDNYLFFIYDFTEDTINPNNEGLYTLRVVKAEEFAGYWQDIVIAGIYKPED